GALANDDRVLAWDMWNEPDNTNGNSYGSIEPPDKVKYVELLLPKVFEWARAAKPKQPITSGVWKGDWSSDGKLSKVDKVQLGMSDVISFHSYEPPDVFEKRISSLKRFNRPLLCTEYMARGNKSTFEGILPLMKKHNIAAI